MMRVGGTGTRLRDAVRDEAEPYDVVTIEYNITTLAVCGAFEE